MVQIPSKAAIVEDVRRIVADVLDISDDEDNPEVSADAPLFVKVSEFRDELAAIFAGALGCSDLDVLEIAVEVESHYDISIDIAEIDKWTTVRDIIRSTEKALGV